MVRVLGSLLDSLEDEDQLLDAIGLSFVPLNQSFEIWALCHWGCFNFQVKSWIGYAQALSIDSWNRLMSQVHAAGTGYARIAGFEATEMAGLSLKERLSQVVSAGKACSSAQFGGVTGGRQCTPTITRKEMKMEVAFITSIQLSACSPMVSLSKSSL